MPKRKNPLRAGDRFVIFGQHAFRGMKGTVIKPNVPNYGKHEVTIDGECHIWTLQGRNLKKIKE